VVFLEDGRFVFSGTVDEARYESPDAVRQFFAAGARNA
jgi:ABC-type transporter Mla maintaining outer membrane lipid asymmetry ATPase subunit MlaF